jgi:hypothetical protein
VDALELQHAVGELVDGWCDRRCLRALREVLNGYPLVSPMTDSWVELVKALEGVRAFARDELTPDESDRLERLIGAASAIAYR